MTREINDFIYDECEHDAWMEQWDREGPEEDEPIAECENCGCGICAGDEPLGFVTKEAFKYRTMYLCKDCAKLMTVTDILTILNISFFESYYPGDGEKVVEKTSRCCREANRLHTEELRRTITTAAKMARAGT